MNLYREQMLVGAIPHDHARRFSTRDQLAVIDEDHRLTWAEVSDRTARAAGMFRRLGIRMGDRVGVVLQNRAQYVEIIYALSGIGAVTVPISYRLTAREVRDALSFAPVTAAIVDVDVAATFEEALPDIETLSAEAVLVVGGEHPLYVDYESAIASAEQDFGQAEIDEMSPYVLAFTGGTSGTLKAAEMPHRVSRHIWDSITVDFGIGSRDTTLIAGPFYHGLGFMFGLQQLMTGGTVVMVRTFDPVAALNAIQRERVTAAPMAPTMFDLILAAPGAADFDISTVRVLASAGAPLMTRTKERILEFFRDVELYEYYGSTEGGVISILKPEDQLRKVRCAGEPARGVEISIRDTDGNEVPIGEVGEIFQRGLRPGARYFRDSAATSSIHHGDWLTSGDLGRMDEEGYLYVVDRAKDMVISGGVNIFPAEVERVLSDHPDVLEVAVIGVPHETYGESVIAIVVARPGASDPDLAAELEALCLDNLARFKRPRRYEFVERLPRNGAGKLLKGSLRAEYAGAATATT